MIEEDIFIKKLENSLINDPDHWEILFKSDDFYSYIIINKLNKFKIHSDGDLIKLAAPKKILLNKFFKHGRLRRIIKRKIIAFSYSQTVYKFNTLNSLFGNNNVVIFDMSLYNKSVESLISMMDEIITGTYQHYLIDNKDLYVYLEKEEDMTFLILKCANYIKM